MRSPWFMVSSNIKNVRKERPIVNNNIINCSKSDGSTRIVSVDL
jgi:hypothetical protein